jgi:hypothetical protein
MTLLLIYLICLFYCSIQLIKKYRKITDKTIIDSISGLEFLIILIFCPIISVVDVSLTWIKIYKEYEKEMGNRQRVF